MEAKHTNIENSKTIISFEDWKIKNQWTKTDAEGNYIGYNQYLELVSYTPEALYNLYNSTKDQY